MFRPVAIRSSPPMRFDQRTGRAADVHVLRWVTDDILAGVAALSGREYVDRAAGR